MKVVCMCGYPKEDSACQAIELTASEKKSLLDQGHKEVPDKCYYCPPCYKLMQHPEHGPLLMRGIFENQMKQAGVPNAKQMADRYYQKLKELQRKAKHGTQS